jgi:GNAT superfamily N-acetyltransferase
MIEVWMSLRQVVTIHCSITINSGGTAVDDVENRVARADFRGRSLRHAGLREISRLVPCHAIWFTAECGHEQTFSQPRSTPSHMSITYSSHLAPLPPSLIDEITELSQAIFSPPPIDYSWRLTNMPDASVFCARSDGRLLGFKAGYAMAERKYYSWLGAVHPDHRRHGIATRLTTLQHEWMKARGYSVVETSSRDNNVVMARVNLVAGFVVVGTKLEPHGLQVLWSKALS